MNLSLVLQPFCIVLTVSGSVPGVQPVLGRQGLQSLLYRPKKYLNYTLHSSSPLLSCSLCPMFSYSSASFFDNGTCTKCSLFAALEVRLRDLEAKIRTL